MRTALRRTGVLLLSSALWLGGLVRADAPNPEPEKIELRLRLQKGQTFDQVVAMEQKSTQAINGRKIAFVATMRYELHNEVLDVESDGAMRVRSTFRRVQFSMNVSPSNYYPAPAKFGANYDSAHPPKVLTPAAAGAAALAGQSLTVTYTPDGKTTKVEGVENIVKRVLELAKVPAAIRANLRKSLEKSTGESTLKSLGAFARFPEHPVGVGDTWQSELAEQTSLPFNLSAQYRLLAHSDGTARVGVSSRFLPNEKGNVEKLGGMETKYALSGNQSGVLSVDEATGLTKTFEMHQRIAGKITVTPAGHKAQSLPLSFTSTTRGWTIALIDAKYSSR